MSPKLISQLFEFAMMVQLTKLGSQERLEAVKAEAERTIESCAGRYSI